MIVLLILGALLALWQLAKLAGQTAAPAQETAENAAVLPGETAVAQLAAVGDIATCDTENDLAVAALLKDFTGRILTLGDNAYPNGTPEEFNNCFNPLYGSLKSQISPAPGNHDYNTKDASGYFSYFGGRAGERGYYNFLYLGWEMFALNSNCSIIGCDAGGEQAVWLKNALAKSETTCQLAYYHHPRFSSGALHGSNKAVDPLWQILVNSGVDIALSGHEHFYERFARLDVNGAVTTSGGTRQFIVGTGGRSLYQFAATLPGSEWRDNQHYGLLKLSLNKADYSWQFVDTSGAVIDSGSDTCH